MGPSPNRLVPASGLVVLVLTVGYVFVVWERLPFAAANLTTAVAGMRAHPQLLGVAFGCQVLALLTSVYFSLRTRGCTTRYAMLHGELAALSDTGKRAVLGLLVVSYSVGHPVLPLGRCCLAEVDEVSLSQP